jgi:hypothetical protein
MMGRLTEPPFLEQTLAMEDFIYLPPFGGFKHEVRGA